MDDKKMLEVAIEKLKKKLGNAYVSDVCSMLPICYREIVKNVFTGKEQSVIMTNRVLEVGLELLAKRYDLCKRIIQS